MLNDMNVGGVCSPVLWTLALIRLACTLLLAPLLSCSMRFCRLPCRPLIYFSLCIVIFYLLLQALTALWLLA